MAEVSETLDAKGQAMPLGTDEIMLCVELFVKSDPSEKLRGAAEAFIASRDWTTSEVFYADQKEEADKEGTQWWSAFFLLGLDHIRETPGDWLADVMPLFTFVQPYALEAGREAYADVRWRSRLWFSEPVAHILDAVPKRTSTRASSRSTQVHLRRNHATLRARPPLVAARGGAMSLRVFVTRWLM